MGVLRNSIDITGITPEEELPWKAKGDLLDHSDVNYIFIPGNRPRAKSISQVSVSVELKSKRIINSPVGKTVILDGIKNVKITYTPVGHSRRKLDVFLVLPYNTVIKLPESVKDSENIDVYIGDAYFHLIDGRKIYNYIYYILDIEYSHEQDLLELSEGKPDSSDPYPSEEQEIPERELINNPIYPFLDEYDEADDGLE